MVTLVTGVGRWSSVHNYLESSIKAKSCQSWRADLPTGGQQGFPPACSQDELSVGFCCLQQHYSLFCCISSSEQICRPENPILSHSLSVHSTAAPRSGWQSRARRALQTWHPTAVCSTEAQMGLWMRYKGIIHTLQMPVHE